MNAADLIEGREIVVCAGAGGVGKTTTSAAIALGAARAGRTVALVTIDPARRLANSLGLEELDNEPRRVERADGELYALMLDAKRTFDEVVERNARDAAQRDAVLSNRIYQELSSAVAGSQEYMAMEKLYELHEDGGYDLIVLDTPPTRNALDFLDAPGHLTRFIDSRSLQFFLAPGRTGLKVFGRGTGMLFGVLKRITGVDLLQDLASFFQSFGDMADGFRKRAKHVTELLGDDRTTFLLVTSPQADAIEEAGFFKRRLADSGMPFGGVIVNRMHTEETDGADPERVERAAAKLLGKPLARKVALTLGDHHRLAERDRQNVKRLKGELGGAPVVIVPYLDDDVHDLEGLERMNEHLFG